MTGKSTSIPDFDANGNLPSGTYYVTMDEIKERFTWSPKRKRLFKGLEEAICNLKAAKVGRVCISGSFISNKENPGDIDGYFVGHLLIDMNVLDPVFWDVSPPREGMKKKYGVDFLIDGIAIGDHDNMPIDEFMKISRDWDVKGTLILDL